MFCHKCGDKSLEDAAFCSKCGAKLITGEEVSQAPVATTSSALETEQVFQQDVANKDDKTAGIGCLGRTLGLILPIVIVIAFVEGGVRNGLIAIALSVGVLIILGILEMIFSKIVNAKIKNSKNIMFGIAGIIVAIVTIVMVFVGRVDYIETVRGYRPYTHLGYNQTYQQVLSHCISDLSWSYGKVGDGAEVTARGWSPFYKNTEIVISVMPIPGERNLFSIDLMSIMVGNERAYGPLVGLELVGMFNAFVEGSSWDGLSSLWSGSGASANESAGQSSQETDRAGAGVANPSPGQASQEILGRWQYQDGDWGWEFFPDGNGLNHIPSQERSISWTAGDSLLQILTHWNDGFDMYNYLIIGNELHLTDLMSNFTNIFIRLDD